jgi:hypothetical protein
MTYSPGTDDAADWLNALKKRSEFSDFWDKQYSDRLGRYGYKPLGHLKELMNPTR